MIKETIFHVAFSLDIFSPGIVGREPLNRIVFVSDIIILWSAVLKQDLKQKGSAL
jgi:hypothetical protein